VHGATLPGAAEDLGDRPLQPFMGVGDAQQHALQAASHEIAQELAPEDLGLGLTVEPLMLSMPSWATGRSTLRVLTPFT
jgi:hypothetical protein